MLDLILADKNIYKDSLLSFLFYTQFIKINSYNIQAIFSSIAITSTIS